MFEKFLKQNFDIEICYSNVSEIEIEISKDKIESSRELLLNGYGIRVIVDGSEGFSSTTRKEDIVSCIRKAKKIAKLNIKRGVRFPEPEKYTKVEGLIDKRIKELTPEECRELTQKTLDINGDNDISISEGAVSVASDTTLIQNSNGIDIEEKNTSMSCVIEALAGENSPGFDYNTSTQIFNPEDVAKNAIKLAKLSRNPIKIEPGNYDIILEPFAINDLFSHLLIPNFNGDRVLRGKSKLKNLVNKKIASKIFNVVDDGTLDYGLGSSLVDGEGTPSQRTVLVEDGILWGFLYDIYTADRAKTRSTGNAVRSFSSLPSIGPTNFIITDGKCSRTRLIEETKNGLLVNHVVGAHTSNPVSGDFAVELENTFLIKDGEIGKCITNGILTGNIYDLLKKIDLIANNTKMVGPLITPSMKIKEMKVVC